MRVRFWGTRGSLAKAGPGTLRYGGNTSCVEVRSAAGTLVILDCGTGSHGLGQTLIATGPQPVHGHILISHTHWDHIQGLPFFAPLFVPGNHWEVYGPQGLGPSLRDTLAGQMQYTYFPITLDQMGATVQYHELVEGTFQIGDIQVRTHYLNHPALTLGYRLEADGVAVVYACDHEPYTPQLALGVGAICGNDQRHTAFLAGADLVIHDAQYTASEYASKIGWGHSTVEYVVHVSHEAGVQRLALTHHDPLRDDHVIDRIMAAVWADLGQKRSALKVFAAAEGQALELHTTVARRPARAPEEGSALPSSAPALRQLSVLVGCVDAAIACSIVQAVNADDIRVRVATDRDAVLQRVSTEQPSLVLVEHAPPTLDGLAVCRAIRSAGTAYARDVPVILTADQEDEAAGAAAGVTDWLRKPFSEAYVRTRVRAWLLRIPCRWQQAPRPVDEERRLAALHQLGLLDTPPEERFDRLTRLAAALFDVPIVLVSLVDHNRQWFKSHYGITEKEFPRDMSFCAHAILGNGVMLVPDTLLDPRFAENPLVTNLPRIRFYAGCPLVVSEGSCVGTLCLIDTRPHDLAGARIGLLQDLGRLVQQELAAASAWATAPSDTAIGLPQSAERAG
jgi:phosphoribosyl 1,2-cyclic phosphodiesterase/CheY-like chemotaxis protein